MLIKCPECGKEISDKSSICVGCGFPIRDYLDKIEKEEKEKEEKEIQKKLVMEMHKCSKCGSQNDIGVDYCKECGTRLTPYKNNTVVGRFVDDFSAKFGIYDRPESEDIDSKRVSEDQKPFHGIYRYGFFGEKQEVYCPRCGSEECSHYQEQRIIPGKTKTRYTANLNPFRPFTLVNKKEKVIRKEQTVTESKFICNSCGKIFD